MKVTFPKCEWCGASDAIRCRNCDRWTCYDCVKYPSQNECIHKKYEPIKSWSWIDANNLYERANRSRL